RKRLQYRSTNSSQISRSNEYSGSQITEGIIGLIAGALVSYQFTGTRLSEAILVTAYFGRCLKSRHIERTRIHLILVKTFTMNEILWYAQDDKLEFRTFETPSARKHFITAEHERSKIFHRQKIKEFQVCPGRIKNCIAGRTQRQNPFWDSILRHRIWADPTH